MPEAEPTVNETEPKPVPPAPAGYAGADMALSTRMGSLIWVLGIILTVILLPLSPPTVALGSAGWAASGLLLALAVACVLFLRSARIEWTYTLLLATSYLGLLLISGMQWLAGDVGAPYERLLLLGVVYVAAIHPPRRIIPFMAMTALALAAPFLYDRWDLVAVAASLAGFIVWTALALVAHVMMRGVRAQRISLREGESQARFEARLDDLTGIGNRRAFEEALEDEVARVGRLGNPLSVAMLDIEQFKRVNDEFGHVEGDKCLRRLAAAVSSELRAPDRCYRWGGDEFALVLPGTRDHGADRLGLRLRQFVAVACKRPDGEPLLVRYGVAQLESGMTANELVARADLTLGRARSGLNPAGLSEG